MKSAWFILSALVAGMLLGIGVELVSPAAGTASLPYIEPIGLLWLNALKMTIVPLIVARVTDMNRSFIRSFSSS